MRDLLFPDRYQYNGITKALSQVAMTVTNVNRQRSVGIAHRSYHILVSVDKGCYTTLTL